MNWEQDVKLNSANMLHIRLGSRGVGDDQMSDLAKFLGNLLKPAEGKNIYSTIDLSENAIGNKGLVAIVNVLERYEVQVKCLKLYKNRIGDEGATRLAELIKVQVEPMEELHLSHNLLTGLTLVTLCLAFHRHKYQAYPYRGRQNVFLPCWVRLEYNYISNPRLCVDLLRKDAGVRICLAEDRDACGPWRCCQQNYMSKGVPSVHLFSVQNAQKRVLHPQSQESETCLRDLILKGSPVAVKENAKATATTTLQNATQPVSCLSGSGKSASAALPSSGYHSTNGGATLAWGQPGQPSVIKAKTTPVPPPQSPVGNGNPAKNDSQMSVAISKNGAYTPMANGHSTKDERLRPKAESSSASRHTEKQREVESTTRPPVEKSEPSRDETVVKSSEGEEKPPAKERPWAKAWIQDNITERESKKPVQVDASSSGKSSASASTIHKVYPAQLLNRSDAFLCPLCCLISPKPVITICSHIFCSTCFQEHVDTTSAQKQVGEKVTAIPCPHGGCDRVLSTKDVTTLDSENEGQKEAAVHSILRRLRSNQQVRCVHHPDLYSESCGAKAASVKDALKCEYIGDLTTILKHQESCPVQKHLESSPSLKADRLNEEAKPRKLAPWKRDMEKQPQPIVEEPQGQDQQLEAAEEEEYLWKYRCIFDFDPQGDNQLQIRVGDLLLVYERCKAGWAAGQILNTETQEPIGAAGWFPEGFAVLDLLVS
eukprot:gnl/MRDRNA2_/MRDRNA2_34315_c0_seq1.p1 gnl/MRDRNA2_/MRDRNA2_34315_c0~~gnl/MRDRNA2_/MRDRNA2_34315_c0_seq1.p1  ORF type:complete len:712 (-),score=132.37 gnl/MRDRNA2_/MRDRNA2_34315_c0_seq1:157-2292(-)